MSGPTETPTTQDTLEEQPSQATLTEALQDMRTDLPAPPRVTKTPPATQPAKPPREQVRTESAARENVPPAQPVDKPPPSDAAVTDGAIPPSSDEQTAQTAQPQQAAQSQQPSESVPKDLAAPSSSPKTTLPPPPAQKPSSPRRSFQRSQTTLPPPPIVPFSRSRNSFPSIKLMPTLRSKFSLPAKAPKPNTKNSRTAFLTAALSPSFVSAKPLHTRAHSTISEIVGNLAPERYLSLPPRSSAAAKALLATSVCKELRDVHKLETIRRRHGDVEGGGWFDYVLDSLGDGVKLRPYIDRLKSFEIRPWDGLIDRVEFLPLESIKIDSVIGHNFTSFVRNGIQHLRVPKGRGAELAESKIQRMKSPIKAQAARQAGTEKRAVTIAVPKTTSPPLPQALDDGFDNDELLAPPIPSQDGAGPGTASAPKPSVFAKAKSAPSKDVVMIDDDGDELMPPVGNEQIQKPKVRVPLFLRFDDKTGKVSVDFEIRELPLESKSPAKQVTSVPSVPNVPAVTTIAPSTTPTTTKNRERTAIEATKANPEPVIQTPTSVKPFPARLSGLDHGNLNDLLGGIDDDISPPKEAEKTQNSDPEVVFIEGAKETPAPKTLQRRTKRKRSDRAQERAEAEQRAARLRSTIASAAQEDTEARRQRNARSSTVNGHSKAKKKTAPAARRTSRRSKKNTAPILDSSGSDKEFRRDLDDDFAIDADDIIEVLPVHKANGTTRAAAPDLSPPMARPSAAARVRDIQEGVTEIESLDGSDMATPRIAAVDHQGKSSSKKVARTGGSQYARLHRAGGSSSRRERHRNVNEDTHEGEPELWNREVLKVERLLEESQRDSDPLLNQIEINPYRFYEQVPILRRVIKASKAQHGQLIDMDKVDEYEEMAQFYQDRRNERSFGPGTGCPGTEFLEHVFHQTERERLHAMHGYAGEETNSTLDPLDERLEMAVSSKGSGGVVNLDGNAGHSSSPSHDSSENSSASSEEEADTYTAGSKRSRSQARSRASKARELQSRVCGDLLATMTNESKRRVLRWAERDFTWFDEGVDVMEIIASRAYKRCNRCETGRGEDENCEESILLKLWKDMSWRKVRRMRHRSSSTN